MKKKAKRILSVSVCLLALCGLLLAGGLFFRFEEAPTEPYFEGEAHLFYFSLLEKGFPHDYAKELTELHLLHPNWSFEPLMVTQTNAAYTWDYVILQETKDPETNLTSADPTYKAYHHEANSQLYDSGYYQASVDAVEYFMDPRNFLNETDIFQFYDLSNHTASSIDEVSAVLAGTFMETERLENGRSYAEYFIEIGSALKINPVYLATKVRQEQGVDGSSPIISGACGDRLVYYYENKIQENENGKQVLTPSTGYTTEQLSALNGYYNFFNVKASGSGLFKIYYNAMNRAVEGTAEMSDAWGGSPSWNTRWKSLWGGAALLKKNYVDRYQSTLYLQKFNVDGRAADRNFWGQYMQNISGAMTESRTLYSAFASVGALDSACTFLIPVYDGMPTELCADPAGGECTILAQATSRYDYQVIQETPKRLRSDGYAIYQSLDVQSGKRIHISGSTSHTYGVKAIQYRIDNGEWITLDTGKHFDFTVTEKFSPNTLHTLTVRGIAEYDHEVSNRKQNQYFLCAVYYINVTD